MYISVIIPTFNRSSFLKDALESICDQNIRPDEYEIIVIDNGSTDNTKKVVNRIRQRNRKNYIKYIYEPEPGLLAGRHRGAFEANGDILVYVDDDIKADKEWLKVIKKTFDTYPDVQLVGGKILPEFEIDPPDWIRFFWSDNRLSNVCGELSLLDLGNKVCNINPNFIWGANFSIKKLDLFELGGFHPDALPKNLLHFRGDGETGLTIKAREKGYKAIYQPNALIYHKIPASRLTYEYFEYRHFIQGISDSFTYIRRKYRKYEKKNSLSKRIKLIFMKYTVLICRLMKEKTCECGLKIHFKQAYINGFTFHQNAVKKNGELLKWVLRENYWDYTLPRI